MTKLRTSFYAVALALTTQAAGLSAQTTLNVRDADIRAFIADAAKVTGRTFIIDSRVQGKVTVVTDRPLATVHAEAPAGRITFGFDADLNAAMGDALDAMVVWMQQLFTLEKAEALALASTTVDLRVTQVANRTWGVHALLPTGCLG